MLAIVLGFIDSRLEPPGRAARLNRRRRFADYGMMRFA
jgi:hypothetical protein